MVGPHFQNKAVTRFNNEDPHTIHSKPLNTIIHGICDFIARNPEVSQSPVLSKKSAIEMLHMRLKSVIAEWAVEEYDNALRACHDDWEPTELAQVKADRSKYAVLWEAEMESAGGATSYGNLVDSSVGRSGTAATIPQDNSTVALQGREDSDDSHASDAGENYDVDGGRQQAVVLKGGDCSAGRAEAHEQTEGEDGHRHCMAVVGTQPKKPPRAAPSTLDNNWRKRPVAQASRER